MTTRDELPIGLIGCGQWGRNYARLFATLPGARLAAVADDASERLDALGLRDPAVRRFATAEALLDAGVCRAVVIATPAATHAPLARRAIEAGLDVLTEKPFTLTVAEAEALDALARARGRILMVAHTFLFNPAVRALRALIRDGVAGDVYYLKARRTHLGIIREDVNAVWDLAPHDLSMFLYLLDETPVEVQAMGRCVLRAGREDAAFINLRFPGGAIANLAVSWADSNKERYLDVVGSRARITFDDLNTLEPIRIFHKGVGVDVTPDTDFGVFKYLLRDGDIVSPKIEPHEPLRVLCQEFVTAVHTRAEPLSGARLGREVVRLLARIDQVLKGAPA